MIGVRPLVKEILESTGFDQFLIAPIEERIEKVAGIFKMDDSLRPFALVPLGYPAEKRVQQDRYDQNRIHYI